MKSWPEISAELKLAALNEGEIHPHVPAERANLFHSHDPGATEYEFLNLIHAIVLATKPALCLETGTYTGLGTIAIASALAWNNYGSLITIDIDECADARRLLAGYGFGSQVQFIQSSAIEFLNAKSGAPFQFVFIDSGGERLGESVLLASKGLLSPKAIVVLHDASTLRNPGATLGSQFENECPLKGYTIPFSRGLRIMTAP